MLYLIIINKSYGIGIFYTTTVNNRAFFVLRMTNFLDNPILDDSVVECIQLNGLQSYKYR